MKSRFYNKIKLEGNKVELPYGKYTTVQLNALLTGGIKSMSVAPHTKVTLYRQDNFMGFSYVVSNTNKKCLKVPGWVKEFPIPVASLTIECAFQVYDVEKTVPVDFNIIQASAVINGISIGYSYYQVLPTPPTSKDDNFGPLNPDIFIIPEFGLNTKIYESVQITLAQRRLSTLMLDYPGVGKSQGSPNLLYSTILEYYRTIGTSLGLFSKKPIVIGHGIGGAIAQLWALTYKLELRNLILVDTAPYALYSIYNLVQPSINKWLSGNITLSNFATIVAMNTYNTVSYDCQPDALKLELTNSFGNLDPASLANLFTQNPDNPAMGHEPHEIKTPTLIIHGSLDAMTSATGGDALNLLIKKSVIRKHQTCHSPMFTIPKKFYADLYRFIVPSGDLYFK